MRTSSPIGLLLDVDAPVASTETRTVPEGIIDVLVRLARRGVPVGFNTGRSTDFLLHNLIAPLRDAGLPDDAPFHAICEKGAVWFPFSAVPAGTLPEVTVDAPAPAWVRTDPAMALDPGLRERIWELNRERAGDRAETRHGDHVDHGAAAEHRHRQRLPDRFGEQQPLQALIALRNLTVEAISTLASNEQKRRIFTILLHKCEFTDELREAEERHHAFINQFIDLCENLLRNASACLRPGVSPRLAALSLHALVVGLFTDWTRDTGLFAPLVDTKALIDPLFRGLVRDWPDDPDQLGA